MSEIAFDRIDIMKPQEDAVARRMIIGGLTGVAFGAVVGITVLDGIGQPIPGGLTHIACTALGALCMTLATLVKGK